jgi:hypothetical protein
MMRSYAIPWSATRTLLAVTSVVIALALAGCAHKDLKAPCSAGEGVTSYAGEDECGPMRRINEPFDQLKPVLPEPMRRP